MWKWIAQLIGFYDASDVKTLVKDVDGRRLPVIDASVLAKLVDIFGVVEQDALLSNTPVYKAGTAAAAGVLIPAFEVGVGGYFTITATTTGAWQDAAGQAGLVAVEGTNDPAGATGWSALRMENPNGQTTTAMRGGGTYGTIITTRWLRVNCLVFKAGTFVANLVAFSKPRQMYRQNIKDQDGIASWEMTPGTGRGHVVSPTPLLGGSFDVAIDPDIWTVSGTGSGTATLVAGNGVKLSTGTTADSTIRIQSTRVADIVPGMSNLVDIIAATEHSGNVGCVKRWGVFDDDSGVFFEQYHDGTTGQVRLRTRKSGVDTTVLLNGTNNIGNNGFGVPLFNLYELQVDPLFVKAKQSGILVALAAGLFPSLLSKYNLPLRFEIINSGGAVTNNTLYIENAGVLRLGPPQTIRADQSFEDDDVLAATSAVIQGRRFNTSLGGFDQVPLPEHVRDLDNEQTVPLTNGTPVTFTADNTTDLLHAVAHGLVIDQPIWLTTTSLLPQGLSTSSLYYVSAPVTVDDFKVSTTRSTALGHTTVNFTDDGAGTLSFKTAGEFTGASYTRLSDFDHSELLYASLGLFVAERIWSDDGVNEQTGSFGRSTLAQKTQSGYNLVYDVTEGRNMAPFYKLHVINGPNNQSAFPGFICINWLFKTPYQGAFSFVDDEPSNLTKALTVKQFHQKTTRLTSTPLTGPQVFTADASANTINKVAHGLILGQPVQFTTTGVLPAPLTTGARYFVRDVLADSFKVAATMSVGIPAAAVDLTDTGTGAHTYEPTFTTRGLASVNGQTPNAQGYFAGTNWADIDLHVFGGPSNATGTLYFYLSHDGVTDHVGPVPHFIRDLSQMIPIPLRNYAYWRVSYKNDLIPQTSFGIFVTQRASVASDLTRFPSQDVYTDEPVKSSQSIIMGAPPDYNDAPNTTPFRRVRVSGTHTLGSLATPLPGNTGGTDHIGVGKWFKGLGDFAMGATDIETDVDGQWRLEFTNSISPTDYTDTDIEDFTDYETYTPSLGIDKSAFAFLTRWARVKYINGTAAQSFISVDVSYFVQSIGSGLKIARRPIKARSVVGMTDAITTSRTYESTEAAPVYVQDVATLNTTTGKRGKNATITKIEAPIGIKPLTSANTSQVTCGTSVAVRLDPFPLADRKSVIIGNMEFDTIEGSVLTRGNGAVFGHVPGLLEVDGFDLPAERAIPILLDVALPIYVRAKLGAGGATNTQTLDGSTASGTAANPNNAKTANTTYATISATGQLVDVNGYAITPTLTTVQSVILGILAKKQNAQFQTVAVAQVKTGSAGNVGTVATSQDPGGGGDGILAGGTQQTYVAFISRENGSANVTGIIGLGLTWVQVDSSSSGGARRIDSWRAVGAATAGIVTASFSANATAAHISVARITGIDQGSPVQDHALTTASSASVVGPNLSGTNKGLYIFGVAQDNTTSTPNTGAGYTERSDETSGGDGLSVNTKPLTATGAEQGTSTLAASKAYQAAGITLLPAVAADPLVTVSYKRSGVDGATSGATLLITTPAAYELDITGDRAWAFSDIALLDVLVTGTTIGDASADIDQVYVKVVETSGPTCRICLHQGAHADG